MSNINQKVVEDNLPKWSIASSVIKHLYPGFLLDSTLLEEIVIHPQTKASYVPRCLHQFKVKEFKFLESLMTYQFKRNWLEFILIESNDEIDLLLSDFASSMYLTYQQHSIINYLSITGIQAFFAEIVKSSSPGLIHLTDFNIDLILEE